MNQAETQQARQYLLGTASEAEAEQVEFRLITDPDYVVEYQILVDQIIDQYVKGMFEGEEIKRVEDFFLKSEERREKLTFALALKRVEAERRKRYHRSSGSYNEPGHLFMAVASRTIRSR